MTVLALAALLLGAAPGRALASADPYASLKPLVGTWLVDKDCVVSREKTLVTVVQRPKQMVVEFRNPQKPDLVLGTAVITYNEVEDHYRVNASLPDNPVLKALHLDSLPGSLVVSDDTDDPNSPGKDYLTCSLSASVFNSLTTAKLRDHYKKATFIFKDETPMGNDQCRGTAVKLKPAAKAKPASGR